MGFLVRLEMNGFVRGLRKVLLWSNKFIYHEVKKTELGCSPQLLIRNHSYDLKIGKFNFVKYLRNDLVIQEMFQHTFFNP